MKRFFKNGATVLFQGDSVTDCGRERNTDCMTMGRMGTGYPRLFKEFYDTLFPNNNISFVNRGISGNKVCDILNRYDEDIKAVNPDYISIMIGINDTWRAYDSNEYCPVEEFEKNYTELLSKIKSDFPNTKIMIMEQFAFTCHPDRCNWHEDLDPKRDVTRKLAKQYADYFLPMYDIMNETDKTGFTMEELSWDGVHPTQMGHALIMSEMMKAVDIL